MVSGSEWILIPKNHLESATQLGGLYSVASPRRHLLPFEVAESDTMQTLHAQGRCAPCLYYTRKKDGCRKGLDGLDYAVTSFKRLWDDKKRQSIWSAEDWTCLPLVPWLPHAKHNDWTEWFHAISACPLALEQVMTARIAIFAADRSWVQGCHSRQRLWFLTTAKPTKPIIR